MTIEINLHRNLLKDKTKEVVNSDLFFNYKSAAFEDNIFLDNLIKRGRIVFKQNEKNIDLFDYNVVNLTVALVDCVINAIDAETSESALANSDESDVLYFEFKDDKVVIFKSDDFRICADKTSFLKSLLNLLEHFYQWLYNQSLDQNYLDLKSVFLNELRKHIV